MHPPVISVVIPVHNGADTIGEQLDAVLCAQRIAPASEIIVVDNRSTDGTPVVVHDWAVDRNADVRVIPADERAGEPYARNVGLAAASGEFIIFCDADDAVSPTWIRSMHELLANAHYASGPIDMESMNPEWIANVRGHSVTKRSLLLETVPFAHGCNMGFRTQTLRSIGGFDERYSAGCDLDIAIRMWEAGHDLAYAEDAVISYRLRPSLIATFKQGEFYGRYRIPIHDRLRARGLAAPSRRARRLFWLARNLGFALVRRDIRARWSWVAGQLLGEHRGVTGPVIDLTTPEHAASRNTQ